MKAWDLSSDKPSTVLSSLKFINYTTHKSHSTFLNILSSRESLSYVMFKIWYNIECQRLNNKEETFLTWYLMASVHMDPKHQLLQKCLELLFTFLPVIHASQGLLQTRTQVILTQNWLISLTQSQKITGLGTNKTPLLLDKEWNSIILNSKDAFTIFRLCPFLSGDWVY